MVYSLESVTIIRKVLENLGFNEEQVDEIMSYEPCVVLAAYRLVLEVGYPTTNVKDYYDAAMIVVRAVQAINQVGHTHYKVVTQGVAFDVNEYSLPKETAACCLPAKLVSFAGETGTIREKVKVEEIPTPIEVKIALNKMANYVRNRKLMGELEALNQTIVTDEKVISSEVTIRTLDGNFYGKAESNKNMGLVYVVDMQFHKDTIPVADDVDFGKSMR